MDIDNLARDYAEVPPTAAAFDTETTGLHIIHDRPFVFQFGWYNAYDALGFIYAIDLEVTSKQIIDDAIRIWHMLVKSAPIYLGHNVKFDLHMLSNYGVPYTGNNIHDTQIFIRMAHDNIPSRAGGVSLTLKTYAVKYLSSTAKDPQKLIKKQQTEKAKIFNNQLQARFNKIGPGPRGNTWTIRDMKTLLDDIVFDVSDLEEPYLRAYYQWYNNLNQYIRRNMTTALVKSEDIPYTMVDRNILITYAFWDIIDTLEVYRVTNPVIKARSNELGLKLEQDCIMPLYRMERVGFKIDYNYLAAAKGLVKGYIRELREELYDLAGTVLTISQHKLIKKILMDRFGSELGSTNKEEVTEHLSKLPDGDEKRFLQVVQELRTLEKWYTTYITRYLNNCTADDPRVYTTIHQVGAASGRVTSDFQQFPKGQIAKQDGTVLFNPRKMVLSEGNGLVYLDYSQIELRFQALYTILLKEPDLNLCRAYMPYKCYNQNDEDFDYNNRDHINHWKDWNWYLQENNNKWEPLDLHGATAKHAFHVDESHPNWAKYRAYGKRTNFAKNYGAQWGRIRAMFPELSDQEITDIDEAYYKAFPGILKYQEYCNIMANAQPYVTNMFGVKYYNVSGHNLINMLIQGSAAYYLKIKIVEVDKYLRDKYSVFQMNIHDEMSFIWDQRDDFSIFYDIKRIMEDWEDAPIPIVADMELTTTNWAEKEEI